MNEIAEYEVSESQSTQLSANRTEIASFRLADLSQLHFDSR